jgi:hypothetical protein
MLNERECKNMSIQVSQVHSRRYTVECHDKYGNLKWIDYINNLTASGGLDDILTRYYKGSSYTAAHYAGLTDGSPNFSTADTMESHAGWNEATTYTEANRQTITWGAVSNQSVNNTGAKAEFSINTNNATIGGAFITTDNDKNATAGILIGGGAFTAGDKGLDDGDTLSVSITSSASSA